ncbi:zinc phosphodiesterase ELAC protein 2-like [Lineus longissimus]|uniref:zinc phosphodiesterase ELAC protein 2-like n=1 Tax=Lineus longissimus TaxID=88925 RepID=UPI00315D08A8
MTIFATLRLFKLNNFIHRGVKNLSSSSVARKKVDINSLISKMSKTRVDEASPEKPHMKKRERRQPEMLRHIKYREHVKGKVLPVPGIMNFQVIGTGGRGTPKSVLLITEHYRYLFNCGEGTQRIVTEHKMKPSRIEHIFITHHSWNNIGGLLGMALTLQAVGMPTVTLHGPPEVENMVNHAKRFADTQATNLVKYDASNGSFQDHSMKVDYVPLYKDPTDQAEPSGKKLRLSGDTQDGATGSDVKLCNDMAVAFLCQPKLYPRKILMERCVDLGITIGPQIGQLKNGSEITLPDGKVIKPDDVLSDQLPSQPFLIVECPSVEYLDSLESSDKLKPYQNDGASLDDMLDVIVHMAPHDVLVQPRYQAWISKFPPQTNHLILDDSSSNLVSTGIFKIQTILNLLSDRVFPLLVGQRNGPLCQKPVNLEGPVVSGSTNLVYHYRPHKGFDGEHCIEIDNDEFRKEAMQQEDVEERLVEMRKKLADLESSNSKPSRPYPEIVFLGTGSSVPSKVRNVSGILLHLMEDTCILLDCGEGTLGQIYRYYGDKTAEVLQKLKCVYISHMHADHHMGLFSILFERAKVTQSKDKLILLAPQAFGTWMRQFQGSFYPVEKYVGLIPLQQVNNYTNGTKDENCDHILQHLHLNRIQTTFVRHVPGSFGVALTHQDGWKITYSGDTMPCDNLVKIGMDSDILIHEASMEDDLKDEARYKSHSTTSQAIEIGLQMNAQFILLNHFSQRYAKVPIFSDKFSDKVGFSFDNMRVTMDDIPLFPHFIEPLKAIFAEHYAEMEIKTLKKTVQAKALEEQAKIGKASSS